MSSDAPLRDVRNFNKSAGVRRQPDGDAMRNPGVSLHFRTLVLAVALSGTCACGFASAPSRGRPPDVSWSSPDLTLDTIEVGVSTLADVTRRVGPAPVSSIGDGGEHRDQVCYWQVLDGQKTVLFFESSPMAESPGLLTAQGVALASEYPEAASCSPGQLTPPRTRARIGIRLGLTVEELTRLLGPPAELGATRVEFVRASKVPMHAPVVSHNGPAPSSAGPGTAEVDVSLLVQGVLRDGVLVYFSMSKIVSS